MNDLFSDDFEDELLNYCLCQEKNENINNSKISNIAKTIASISNIDNLTNSDFMFDLSDRVILDGVDNIDDVDDNDINNIDTNRKNCVFSSSQVIQSQTEYPSLSRSTPEFRLMEADCSDKEVSEDNSELIDSDFFDDGSQPLEDFHFYRKSLLTQSAPLFKVQKNCHVNIEQVDDFVCTQLSYESDLSGFVVSDDVY